MLIDRKINSLAHFVPTTYVSMRRLSKQFHNDTYRISHLEEVYFFYHPIEQDTFQVNDDDDDDEQCSLNSPDVS